MTEDSDTQESKTGKRRPLTLSKPGRLELKKTVDAGQVRQNFSHGRSKSVAVEVRRKRTFKADSQGGMIEVEDAQGAAPAEIEVAPEVEVKPPQPETPSVSEEEPAILRTLTVEEKAARARAVKGARVAEEEARREAKRRAAEEEARRKAEAEEARRRAEEESKKAAEEAAAAKVAAEEQGPGADQPEPATPEADAAAPSATATAPEQKPAAAKAASGEAAGTGESEDEPAGRRRAARAEPKRPGARRSEPRRRAGKLTIAQALDDEEKVRSLASVRRARERERRAQQKTQMPENTRVVREVVIPDAITVGELANRMAVRAVELIKALMKMDVMATVNQSLDGDMAEFLVTEFGHTAKRVSAGDVEIGLTGAEDAAEAMAPRPPIVTVMGHVDHGKTSLLDALRETDVVTGEAGGITQHIGAYQVELESGAKITFIDTPGHAAFTEMRARGARATDIVVLVVAADDGIMPQTVEAINHAKAAEVPIIVAINKIDRPNANPDRVRNELLSHDLVVESLGGDVLSIEVSATEKTNLDKLEEAILLQAELLELGANPDRSANGVVVEAKLEQGRGAVATVLVLRGTLRVGDIAVAGGQWGRVRALLDDDGNPIKEAGPSQPVEVLGLNGAPSAGDELVVVENESRARDVTEFRAGRARDERVATGPRGTLEQMFDQITAGEVKELPVVLKSDVQGSAEAIADALNKLGTDEVKVRLLHTGVGGINESDITLAKASGALVLGFNVRANAQARDMAKREGVDIRYYAIIYELADDIKALLSGMLAPEARETFLGYARIKEVFNVSKVGRVAGCEVTEGQVRRGAKVRLLRDDVVIHEGTLSTLKRFKDEVRDVRAGMECGMGFENYQDLKEGDMIECFEVEEVARSL